MSTRKSPANRPGRLIGIGAILVLLVLMFFSTKIFTGSQATQAAPGTFSPQAFAQEKYESEIVPDILRRATDIVTVSTALKADAAAAAKQFGVVSGTSAAVYSVKVTGVAGAADANGLVSVKVDGVPADIKVLVQMGPAVNGTAIRDATGKVEYTQFKNQIDYQNVGAELNNQVKKLVLANVDKTTLEGKSISVIGAFQPINPAAYIVTPVKVDVTK
jgi:predicted lipoprotein